MSPIPRENGPDHTLSLLREGYDFIPNRCRRYGTDIFETRLMLRQAVCMSGSEAARVFYEPDRLTRRGALPPTALTLLQDFGSVAVLDELAHRHRKEMFIRLFSPGRFDGLLDLARAEWLSAAERWQRRDSVVLQEAAEEIICRAVCSWAGVPLSEAGVGARAREFAAMIDGAGSIGARQWRGQLLRQRSERWIRGVIEATRSGELSPPSESVLHVIASYRALDGELLDAKVAAIELINVLRPTVAVARFVTFAALAMHAYPETRDSLRDGTVAAEHFIQEVRRFYPFFPFVAGRVMNPFSWRGHHFPEGRLALLDLYGTNRDPRSWDEPERFRPERFRDWKGDAFTLIPQGGGDHHSGHRCPGEWITIALTKSAVEFLTFGIAYEVPEQDLRVRLSRMPAIPESGFRISNVRPPKE